MVISNLLSKGPSETHQVNREEGVHIKSFYWHLGWPLYCKTLSAPSTLSRVQQDRLRRKWNLCLTGSSETGVVKKIGIPCFGPIRRKTQGSRRHVHSVYVYFGVSQTRRKDLKPSGRKFFRTRRQQETTDEVRWTHIPTRQSDPGLFNYWSCVTWTKCFYT